MKKIIKTISCLMLVFIVGFSSSALAESPVTKTPQIREFMEKSSKLSTEYSQSKEEHNNNLQDLLNKIDDEGMGEEEFNKLALEEYQRFLKIQTEVLNKFKSLKVPPSPQLTEIHELKIKAIEESIQVTKSKIAKDFVATMLHEAKSAELTDEWMEKAKEYELKK
ncbi:hypothetical protein ACFL5C_00065 [Candidatus Omnitrophota bacterium]